MFGIKARKIARLEEEVTTLRRKAEEFDKLNRYLRDDSNRINDYVESIDREARILDEENPRDRDYSRINAAQRAAAERARNMLGYIGVRGATYSDTLRAIFVEALLPPIDDDSTDFDDLVEAINGVSAHCKRMWAAANEANEKHAEKSRKKKATRRKRRNDDLTEYERLFCSDDDDDDEDDEDDDT